MKITYNNYIGDDCNVYRNDEKDYIIGATKPCESPTKITLFNPAENDNAFPIYAELAAANTLDKATNFYKKYGSIINPRLTLQNDLEYHSFQTLHMFENYNTIYDCTSYKHFCYYQVQMMCLMDIQRLLHCKDMPSDETLNSLLSLCISLVYNPHFSTMFELEYTDTHDKSKYLNYFSSDPIIAFIYAINYRAPWEDISFSNPSLRDFLISILLEYEDKFSYDFSFLSSNKEKIIDLAQYLFSGILSFELRNIRPIINFFNSEIEYNWNFSSLINAIYFFFYLDVSGSKIITRCANNRCNKIFTHSGTYSNRKYCSPECAHRTANRNYKQRLNKKPQ